MNPSKSLVLLALVVLVAMSFAEAHKNEETSRYYGPGPGGYHEGPERCVCDCSRPQPVLPNKPYYGSGGYHQPRPAAGGYGGAGAYAVSGSYGSGGGQTSGGY